MHTRYPRAAVEIGDAPTHGSHQDLGSPSSGFVSTGRPSSASQPLPTLWASRTFQVRQGRAIGVRLRAGTVQVALVADGADALRWVDAESVLTESQANQWLRTTRFSSSGG